MSQRLQIRLLGEQELTLDAARLALPPSKKTRALLAYLVMNGRPQRRERLCDLLWDVADDPRAALRWSLSKLRELLDADGRKRLLADRQHVWLELDGASVDVFEARRLVADERAGVSESALEQALSLFRGELLEGLELPDFHAYHAFCLGERESARALHVRLLTELLERNATRPERALPLARKWVELEPTSDSARATFQQLLHASGREREAMAESRTSSRLLASAASSAFVPMAPSEARDVGGGQENTQEFVQPAPRRSELPQPFVGHKLELERLATFVQSRSSAGAMLVTGQAGIGKSRLLSRLLERERALGRSTFRAAAHEVDPGFPYAPWSYLLEAAECALDSTGAGSAPQGARSEREREPWLASAARALLAHFKRGDDTVLLVVEDLQWFDEASVRLLQHLLRAARGERLALVMSARFGELLDNGPVRRLLRSLRSEGLFSELALGPLAPAETATLVSYVASGVDAARVHEESAGNPLYAIELARSPTRDRLPSSIARVVRDRMDALSAELVDALRWASVLGRDFRMEQLELLMGLDPSTFVDALEQLERLGWLTFDAERIGFSHEIARRAVYYGLSSPRRRLMHARIARLLAARSDGEKSAAELAHHAVLGGDAEMAVRACLEAGRRCLQLYAVADALALARRGLGYVHALDARESCLLEIELHELALYAQKPAQPDVLAARLLSLSEEALSRGELTHARRCFFLHSFLRWEQGQVGDAQRFSREAERCSRLGGPRERLLGLADAARCLALLERDLTEAQAFILEAETLVKQGEPELAGMALASGLLAQLAGERDEATRLLTRARELAEREGDRMLEFGVLEALLDVLLWSGALERAEAVAEELVKLGQRHREGSEAAFAEAALLLVRCLRGHDVEEPLGGALERLRVVDAKQRGAYVLVRWAEHALAAGAHALAAQRAAQALVLAEAVERTTETVLARVVLARAALHAGDRDSAERERVRIDELAREPRAISARAQEAYQALLALLPAAGATRRRARGGSRWNE